MQDTRTCIVAVVAKEIASRKIKHADQVGESDASFLRRIAQTYDRLCTVKTASSCSARRAPPRTPSGKMLPPCGHQPTERQQAPLDPRRHHAAATRVAGYKRKIDQPPWIVASVRHTLDQAGCISQLTLETEQADGVEGQEGASADA